MLLPDTRASAGSQHQRQYEPTVRWPRSGQGWQTAAGRTATEPSILSLGPSGRFSLQSEHKESSLWLLSKNRILRCPMSVHKRRDVMQVVGDVRCELSDVDALPQALQISPRVIRLLNVAGLLRHSVQEA